MYALGFMQGRLSPKVAGKIQAFPREHWQNEFILANQNGWRLMEWTLDQEGFDENPVMTDSGRQTIHQLMREYNITIPSATADFTMQAPFYKASGGERTVLLEQLRRFLNCAAEIGIRLTVVPLVDNGSLTNEDETQALKEGLATLENVLEKNQQMIIFESDFSPARLAEFIANFRADLFGINYDSGNSASLGYHPHEEWTAYGKRIQNVHIKDRVYQGTTVPLGAGATNFVELAKQLQMHAYQGNLIFQTARAESDAEHVTVLNHYRHYIEKVLQS